MDDIFLFKDQASLIYDKILLQEQDPIKNLEHQGFIILKDLQKDQVIQYPTWIQNIRNISDPINNNECNVINQNNRIIIIHNKGRKDISPIYDLVDLQLETKVEEILNKIMKCQFVCKSKGVLTLDKDTDSFGKWHRDTPFLFLDDDQNIAVPDYYFTVFIPLNNITNKNGPTQIIPGSHKLRIEDAKYQNKI